MNIGFLASGRGSNMQAVIDAVKAGRLRNIQPVVVISNNSDSGALERAARENMARLHLSSATHHDPAALDSAILDALRKYGTELVVLVGYMKKLGTQTLRAYKGRIVNIHPALLPKHGGQGMYGIHVHEAVIAAREKETGVTIHVVDEEYDKGPILAQARVPVMPGDTAQTLAARVLKREHSFLVETLGDIVSGEIRLSGNVFTN